MCAKSLQSCLTLCDSMDCSPPGSSVHRDSPGKNTGVGCHALLQGIFPTQGSNPGLPHCRRILYRLSHQGSSNYFTGQHYIAAHWGSGSSEPWASWSATHSSPYVLCRRDLRLQLHIQGHPLLCQPDGTLHSHLFIPTSHCSGESLGHLLS